MCYNFSMTSERIICTGSPKTGTHALLKAVRLFYNHIGLPEHMHLPHSHKKLNRRHVHITRNPRNTLVSWIRFNREKVTTGSLIGHVPQIIKENFGYAPYLSDADLVHNVRLEELLSEPSVIEGVGKFIGLPIAENHFADIWGDTYTFTGKLSEWQDYWSDDVDAAWVAHNGPELEKALGYAV